MQSRNARLNTSVSRRLAAIDMAAEKATAGTASAVGTQWAKSTSAASGAAADGETVARLDRGARRGCGPAAAIDEPEPPVFAHELHRRNRSATLKDSGRVRSTPAFAAPTVKCRCPPERMADALENRVRGQRARGPCGAGLDADAPPTARRRPGGHRSAARKFRPATSERSAGHVQIAPRRSGPRRRPPRRAGSRSRRLKPAARSRASMSGQAGCAIGQRDRAGLRGRDGSRARTSGWPAPERDAQTPGASAASFSCLASSS